MSELEPRAIGFRKPSPERHEKALEEATELADKLPWTWDDTRAAMKRGAERLDARPKV